MNKALLSVHVLAAIIFIGPVTVAVSLFPRYARQALAAADDGSEAQARQMYRISKAYALLGLSVPLVGLILAARLHALGELYVAVSIALTAAAALMLAIIVVPQQREAIALLDHHDTRDPEQVHRWTAGVARLSMISGSFALLWAIVVVLMVWRPGSTTGL